MKKKVFGAAVLAVFSILCLMQWGMWEPVWEPYWTGAAQGWSYVNPWGREIAEGETDTWDQSRAQRVYDEAIPEMKKRDDYGGYYFNCSGTLTVLVVDPTEETAEEYASLTEEGFWILGADYTEEELEDAREGLWDEIQAWIEANPEEHLQLGMVQCWPWDNRVQVMIYGPDITKFQKEFPMPACVALDFRQTAPAGQQDIPRDPENCWTAPEEGVTVSMAQPSYPVGTETLTVVLENMTPGLVEYGESYRLEKYVDGQWMDALGNYSFNAVGYNLEMYGRRTLEFSTENYPVPLDVGLYRLSGGSLSYTPEDGMSRVWFEDYTVEFTVTEDAPEPTGVLPEKEGIWLSSGEVVPEGMAMTSVFGRYVVANDYNMLDTMQEEPYEVSFQVFDRLTGEGLLEEPFVFLTQIHEGITVGRDKKVYIETEEALHCLYVEEGEVILEEAEVLPDETYPALPVTSAQTWNGLLTMEMTQESYPAEEGKAAFLLTNNTPWDVVVDPVESTDSIQIMYLGWNDYCFRDPGPEACDLLREQEEGFTLKAGETREVSVDLTRWRRFPNGDDAVPLGPGLYKLELGLRTWHFDNGTEYTGTICVEFMLE